jgi:hypothetical protein
VRIGAVAQPGLDANRTQRYTLATV